MIDLHTWPTPNGHKVHIMLEETGLEYRVIPVDINQGGQFEPDFLAISPNNKMPAIVDHDGPGAKSYSLFESGAILMYLADKTGQLLPENRAQRYDVIQWLMFQMGGVGPILGQTHHFLKFNPGASNYSAERFGKEARRLYGVLDKRLGESHYLAGDDFSIADIATWPWVSRFEWQQVDLSKFSNVCRWYKEIAERPAVQRGYDVPHKVTDIPVP